VGSRETVTPTGLIVIGAVALIVGAAALAAHLRGHGASRTTFGPLFMAAIGATMLLAGIVWSLLS
jgi:hypothetical protein